MKNKQNLSSLRKMVFLGYFFPFLLFGQQIERFPIVIINDTIIGKSKYNKKVFQYSPESKYIMILDSLGNVFEEGSLYGGLKVGLWSEYFPNGNSKAFGSYFLSSFFNANLVDNRGNPKVDSLPLKNGKKDSLNEKFNYFDDSIELEPIRKERLSYSEDSIFLNMENWISINNSDSTEQSMKAGWWHFFNEAGILSHKIYFFRDVPTDTIFLNKN